MTFIPENATVCKCVASMLPEETNARPDGLQGRQGCPHCDGMGWYWVPAVAFQDRQRRRSGWWWRVRFKRAK